VKLLCGKYTNYSPQIYVEYGSFTPQRNRCYTVVGMLVPIKLLRNLYITLGLPRTNGTAFVR